MDGTLNVQMFPVQPHFFANWWPSYSTANAHDADIRLLEAAQLNMPLNTVQFIYPDAVAVNHRILVQLSLWTAATWSDRSLAPRPLLNNRIRKETLFQ